MSYPSNHAPQKNDNLPIGNGKVFVDVIISTEFRFVQMIRTQMVLTDNLVQLTAPTLRAILPWSLYCVRTVAIATITTIADAGTVSRVGPPASITSVSPGSGNT